MRVLPKDKGTGSDRRIFLRQVILNFHGIGVPDQPLEPGEAPYWVTEDFFKEVLARAEYYKTRVHTAFTFDDGNQSDLEIGAQWLARHNRTATFFVLADRIGQRGSLDVAGIRALVDAGHSIGSHGAAHIDWKMADAATLEHELGQDTRNTIADAATHPITSAAIPFGRYNATVLRALSRHGYARVYSSDGGSWRPGQNPIPRTSLRHNMTMADIENLLIKRMPAGKRLRQGVSRTIKKTF